MRSVRRSGLHIIPCLIFLIFGGMTIQNTKAQPAGWFDVTQFGAQPNDGILDTEAIQSAIDSVSQAGGGIIAIPAGRFLSGPLFLRSHIEVRLLPGAVLKADTLIANYPAVEGRWEGIERKVYASLFTGHDLEHVSITGSGTIDGSGEVWWEAFYATDSLKKARGITAREAPYPKDAPLTYPRPRVINLYRSSDILIRDVTIINSPSWTIHPVYSQRITIDHVTIIQPYDSPNTDGINPDSSSDIAISNCHIDVGDDCIAIKSGYNTDGRRVGMPSENITITNCMFKRGRGGVVIGSEMSGDVRNVVISNSIFDGTLRGIRIKSARGRGGVVERVRASNLVMRDIADAAFSITAYYGWSDPKRTYRADSTTPAFRSLHFSDITIANAHRTAVVRGLPEQPIEDVTFSRISTEANHYGITVSDVSRFQLNESRLQSFTVPSLSLSDAGSAQVSGTALSGSPNRPAISVDEAEEVALLNSSVIHSEWLLGGREVKKMLADTFSSSHRIDTAHVAPKWDTNLAYEQFEQIEAALDGHPLLLEDVACEAEPCIITVRDLVTSKELRFKLFSDRLEELPHRD